MTNDTTLTENGAADHQEAAAIAAITSTAETTADAPVAESLTDAEAPPAAPAPPSFDDLGLHADIKQALDDMGYFAPTAVQTAVYKPVSEGKDLLVQSRTGTGKTTAFGLPTINNLIPTHRAPQALILCPTRELALQVARELTQIGKHRGVLVETLYGGAPIGKQIAKLKEGVHVIVGTPGRVLDHIGRRTLDCRTISTFILDECDEMLSMGFLEDIERVVASLPEKKQTLLFSATMPDEVARYARRHMKGAEQLSLSRDSISVTDIHHAYYIVSGIARSRDLLKIIYAEEPESAIIFCNMRDETTMVARFLQKQGLDAEPLSSDLSQADRERVMNRMKAKSLRFLCATDVAARGIDISNLSHVINYSVPEQPEIYVHRTGRTGRAGKKGVALSMVGPRELGNFRYVRLTFGIKPEERVLPKDDIFIGKLKVPLPPVGIPQPPDPVQILIRGVPGTPTDLERQIFEKLLATANGKRVLAALVAERLDKLSTRAKPKRTEQRTERPEESSHSAEGGAGGDRSERPRFDGPPGGDRPRRDYGDRPRDDRGPRGGGDDRPRWRDRDDRGGGGGERRFDRDRPSGDRPSGDRPGGDRPAGDRPAGDRPEGERERPPKFEHNRIAAEGERERPPKFEHNRPSGDRPEGDRPRRDYNDRDRGDRPAGEAGGERQFDRGERSDRGERGGRYRDRDRDRGRDRDRSERPAEPAAAAPAAAGDEAVTPILAEALPDLTQADAPVVVEAPVETRDRDRDRDRGDRDRGRGRDRDRGGRDRDRDRAPRDTVFSPPPAEATEVGTEAAPAVETETVAKVVDAKIDAKVDKSGEGRTRSSAEGDAKVEDVARAAIERADRGGDRKGKRGDKKEATTETREFWETWADEKTTREPAATEEAAPAAAASSDEDKPAAKSSRSRGGRDRGGRSTSTTTSKKTADKEADDKPAGRTKRDTTPTPPPAMDASQARLFISLGKKHGVSADDLRELLAKPVGGDKARIGSVSLRDSHAHVRVPEELVEGIIAGVHGTQHNDHDVTVERARA